MTTAPKDCSDFVFKNTKANWSKAQVTANRQAQARWVAYTTGNAYVLYVRNRTSGQVFRVQGYGKNVLQAVRRYYRRVDNAGDKWVWQCTQVVAVYTCANTQTGQAGDLLVGQAQDSFPY